MSFSGQSINDFFTSLHILHGNSQLENLILGEEDDNPIPEQHRSPWEADYLLGIGDGALWLNEPIEVDTPVEIAAPPSPASSSGTASTTTTTTATATTADTTEGSVSPSPRQVLLDECEAFHEQVENLADSIRNSPEDWQVKHKLWTQLYAFQMEVLEIEARCEAALERELGGEEEET